MSRGLSWICICQPFRKQPGGLCCSPVRFPPSGRVSIATPAPGCVSSFGLLEALPKRTQTRHSSLWFAAFAQKEESTNLAESARLGNPSDYTNTAMRKPSILWSISRAVCVTISKALLRLKALLLSASTDASARLPAICIPPVHAWRTGIQWSPGDIHSVSSVLLVLIPHPYPASITFHSLDTISDSQ